MAEHSFSLTPFRDGNIPNINITGHIARHSNRLTIYYLVSGEIEKILFPRPSIHAARKDELWTATCFEFFLAIPGQPHYWEFNMSPSGDWNVYRMDAYRRIGFRVETAVQQLPFDVKIEPKQISIDAALDLISIVTPKTPIQVGITSVVQTTDKRETYWALHHPNPQADFHLRASFIIHL